VRRFNQRGNHRLVRGAGADAASTRYAKRYVHAAGVGAVLWFYIPDEHGFAVQARVAVWCCCWAICSRLLTTPEYARTDDDVRIGMKPGYLLVSLMWRRSRQLPILFSGGLTVALWPVAHPVVYQAARLRRCCSWHGWLIPQAPA
jgi:hypothetical protein